jgi:3'-5' exoribonuclease
MNNIKYNFIKIESINKGSNFFNLNVIDQEKNRFSIKINDDLKEYNYLVDHIYWVKLNILPDEKRENKTNIFLLEIKELLELNYEIKEVESILKNFFELKVELEKNKNLIFRYAESMENVKLKEITFYILTKFKYQYFVYPAAMKLHHSYIGGLVDHTLGMLKLADSLLAVYPGLNKSLIYSGILLHDVMKVFEFSDYINPAFTKKGSLIGHISMIMNEVNLASHIYKYEDSEEILMLEHILLSHHGQFNFGSPKRPQTAEAFIVNYIDSLDSKMVEIIDALNKTNDLEFTEPIGVCDKLPFYKHNIK